LTRAFRTLFQPLALKALLLLVPALPALAQSDYASHPLLPNNAGSIRVVDRRGRPLGRILPQKRYWVTLDRIPAFLQKAVISVEDARFYEHNGIDLRGIARALLKDVAEGKLVQGGSTITQQLVKNKYLSSEISLDRKVKEASLALELEKKYTKAQILEMYFNEIYFGRGVWGLAQAARFYFDKRPEELSEAECVLLAGVPKNPNRYNPMGKPSEVAGRRDVVLKRMLDLGVISSGQRQQLQRRLPPVREPSRAPHYLARIRAQLAERFGTDRVEQGGFAVDSSLDLDLQAQAEQVLRDGVKRLAPDLQGALLCLDPVTGDVLAAVGDVDGHPNTLNRAFSAQRQPGSAIKPFIYAAALEQGLTAASLWSDAPAVYDRGSGVPWKPLNYGGEQHGVLSLRRALALSSNVVTVKVLETIGIPYFVDFAGRMGLALRAQSGLSLALGTEEVTLNDLVQAYTPLATGGTRVEARCIRRIHDLRRDVWIDTPSIATPVLSPAAAFLTTELLKDVLTYGTAKSLKKFSEAIPAAGKTGTTDNYVDAWFVGYTPAVVTGVWVGYDQPRPGGRGFTGGAVAAPIWERFMRKAVAAGGAADFPRPETIVTLRIDPATGLPAREGCPEALDELFMAGTEPTGLCPLHDGAGLTSPAPAPPEEAAVPDPEEPAAP